jgi:hypothetical protein
VLGLDYAMVQVIENRADVDGRVVEIKSDADRPEHKIVTIEIGSTTEVAGYPNLFGSVAGKRLDVVLPAELAKDIKAGSAVRCRIRRAGPTTVLGERCSSL